jgi:hypothetical protein
MHAALGRVLMSGHCSGCQRCERHERLRAVDEHFLDLDADREARALALHFHPREQLGIARDRGAPVHAQGLAAAGTRKSTPACGFSRMLRMPSMRLFPGRSGMTR